MLFESNFSAPQIDPRVIVVWLYISHYSCLLFLVLFGLFCDAMNDIERQGQDPIQVAVEGAVLDQIAVHLAE